MNNQNSTAPTTGDARAKRLVHPVDLAVAAIILAGVGYLFYVTTQFDEVSPLFAQHIQPAMYPQLLLWIIGALACILPFEHILLTKKGKNIDKDRSKPVHQLTKLTIAFLVVVVLAAPYLGMLLTMITICLIMPRLWGSCFCFISFLIREKICFKNNGCAGGKKKKKKTCALDTRECILILH